mmetsp:Transcript_20498/g.36842  ORF Transcript_20498/g.36842 Transcript_20498/m.36842 type:complete len:302 (-) Transcript_20498:84-989(-)|eukprot:CAMPEP_0197657656 /NCGR_PEP_ID=MMETSP1338-20131121/44768_1 /TAXON_ID=43686 ORGANISM="Pelagodinium beii, Strain RCC1491" /NCGR_SAMPLE_ID=MMETSP1338 /ASSEMBLY_ACC=CAM_ASM_000754 /LENGTH=301 /DNA_ID=CAMNT_0043234083 /DNA_START=34 /DNA_END=939 /DNA_ORIENTATION=+
MPFETVQEQYVRDKKILVCEQCRRQMSGVVENRNAYRTGGSIAGSLGGSVVAGGLAGAVLGPVGSIAGAIGGAVAGSRGGAMASDGVCDVIDSNAKHLCEACKASPAKPTGQRDWGGGRLGTTDEDPQSVAAAAPPQASSEASEPTVGDRISEATSQAGQNISEAAASAGEQLSGFGSWIKSKVTGESDPSEEKQKFKAFEGGGRALSSSSSSAGYGGQALAGAAAGPVPSSDEAAQRRRAAAEAAMRRASGAGYAASPSPQAPAPSPQVSNAGGINKSKEAQMAEDEALARKLQEELNSS